MRGRLAAIVLILAASCAPLRARQTPPNQVLEHVLRASVQVILEQAGERIRSGSGVVIARRGGPEAAECILLTTAHSLTPLDTGTDVFVLFDRDRGPGVAVRADVVALRDMADLDLDLALLRTHRTPCTPTRLGRVPRLGDPVWTVGFPWGRELRLAAGIVSQVTFDERPGGTGPARLMVDASVASGVSGGGVFDARTGYLLGLVEGLGTARVSLGDASVAQHIDVPMPGETYVIAMPTIRHFLRASEYADVLESAAPAARRSTATP